MSEKNIVSKKTSKSKVVDVNESLVKEKKVNEQPNTVPPDVITSLRYLGLDNLKSLQDYIYKNNKEAFDLYFMINSIAENNLLNNG